MTSLGILAVGALYQNCNWFTHAWD